jgi:hypothetical protein
MWAFLSTYATALAYIEIGLKPCWFFFDALRWAIYPAYGAFDALFTFYNRALCAPFSGFNRDKFG